MKVIALINANRYRGHRGADLDPIKVYERPPIPELYLEYHGFGEDDLDRTFNTGTLHIGKPEATLREIDALLRDTYRGPIGIEVTHLSSTGQKRWVQERLEGSRGRPGFDAAKKRDVLRWVTAARKLEDYLHRKYVGQKRFSLEGGENLIPLLDEIVQDAGRRGVREAVIGMAHRGRLNVLVNILGKHPKVLFGEFEGKIDVGSGSGDGQVPPRLLLHGGDARRTAPSGARVQPFASGDHQPGRRRLGPGAAGAARRLRRRAGAADPGPR